MVRRIFLLFVFLALASLSFAQNTQSAEDPPSLIRLQAGKNPEGIAVNPITHKAYIVAEVDNPDRQVVMVFDEAVLKGTSAPKLIQIPDETEYITVDPFRNRVYLSTRYSLDTEEGGEIEPDAALPAQTTGATLGTLTVIDGNTDTVIASYRFPEGVEPEGVAVDVHRNIVYVGTKAPNPEPANGACPWGTFFIDEDGDEECWTAGSIVAFNAADITTGPIKTIPAGDDPESVVFANDLVYAANEDDGTITIASAVRLDGSGGKLVTDTPAYSPAHPPYGLGVFYRLGPNTLACPDKRYEADKMAVGPFGMVYITDDKSRVAQILGATVFNTTTIPIDPILGQCIVTPSSDENGLNTANNIAFMWTKSGPAVYVVSEQNTVALLDPLTLAPKGTITIPKAFHLDAIGVDNAAKRVWITDEAEMAVFVLRGGCADGTVVCQEEETTTPATISWPISGSTLTSSRVTFTWTATAGASSYQLWVGTTFGAYDLGVVSTTGLSTTISNLPMNGVPLFARICTLRAGTWFYNDYTYTAATIPIATISSPAPGSTLTGRTATFTWTSAAGATSYQLWLGTTLGAHDLGVVSTTGLSATIGNMPLNGVPLFVKMCTLSVVTWHCNDYAYTAATIPIATISSPVPGSTLTGSIATFSWAAATGATSYQVWGGTTLGAHDLAVVSTAGLSATFSSLPTNGVPLFVKMCTLTGGAWYCNDYTYTTGP